MSLKTNIPDKSRKVILSALLIVFFFNSARTQNDTNVTIISSKRVFNPQILINAGLKTYYDDNILKYSDTYLQSFINNEDQGRFQINTYDDLVLKPSLSLNISDSVLKGKLTRLKLFLNRSIYTHNGINDYTFFSFGLEQNLKDSCKVGLAYEYIPEYYIYHLRDADYTSFMGYVPSTFMPLTYSKDWFGLYVYRTYKKTGIKLSLNYAQCFYNSHFIEYDSKEPGVEIEISQPLHRQKLKLKILYAFSRSFARGYDQNNERADDSDDSDASFYFHTLKISAGLKLPKLMKHSNHISFTFLAGFKRFTSGKYIEYDMLHAGRKDFNYQFEFEYNYYLSKHLSLSLMYSSVNRNATSLSDINSSFIDNEKSFNQNLFGLGLNYRFYLSR